MYSFVTSPLVLFKSIVSNANLLKVLIVRDIASRYKGSVLGIFWSLLMPLFMLIVYTFVFSVAFNARWGDNNDDSKASFALILFAGLIIFNLFSECVNRAPSIILCNANYVKKMVFPLELLPVVILGSALFNALLSLVVWVVGFTLFLGIPHIELLLVPVLITPFAMFILGATFFLSSVGVFIRDTGHVMGILTTIFMFLSPIFYPLTAIPEKYRYFLYFNPLTPFLSWIRDALYWGRCPDWHQYGYVLIASWVVLCVGFVWFQKTRKGFADVI